MLEGEARSRRMSAAPRLYEFYLRMGARGSPPRPSARAPATPVVKTFSYAQAYCDSVAFA